MVAATQFSFLVLLMAAMASSTSAATPTANTATTDTTAATTTVAASSTSGSAAPAGSSTASGPTAAPGTGPTTTAAPGTGPTTTAAPGPDTTRSPILACLHCNGTDDSNDPCRTAAATTWNTNITCNTAAGCWVYREENTTSGDFTISRGCGRSDVNDGECTEQKQTEQCENANGLSVCRRCCTSAMCNDVGQTLVGPGSVGTPTAYVSTVVIVTSFIMAVFSNDLLL
ncbi:PREDICTED: mucin-5AC-like [Branchiostoma belcheri]|uniref:Mucin-5AC-like n=1 Tax=Branchiostoma belcheri TaxID=7741 RepID=A0A6P5ABP2_BRABE|nr:PREDICTED: mucin-5AC-like [Branchiostoma belcheri]